MKNARRIVKINVFLFKNRMFSRDCSTVDGWQDECGLESRSEARDSIPTQWILQAQFDAGHYQAPEYGIHFGCLQWRWRGGSAVLRVPLHSQGFTTLNLISLSIISQIRLQLNVNSSSANPLFINISDNLMNFFCCNLARSLL